MFIRRRVSSFGVLVLAAALLVPLTTASVVLATGGVASATSAYFYCTDSTGTVGFAEPANPTGTPPTQATAGLSSKGQIATVDTDTAVDITNASMADCANATTYTGTNVGPGVLGASGSLSVYTVPCEDDPGHSGGNYCTSTVDGFLPSSDHLKYWFDSGYTYEQTGTATILAQLSTIDIAVDGQSLVFHSKHVYSEIVGSRAGFKLTGYVTDAADSAYKVGSSTTCTKTSTTGCLASIWTMLNTATGNHLASGSYFLASLNLIASYTSTHTTMLIKTAKFWTGVNSTGLTTGDAYTFMKV